MPRIVWEDRSITRAEIERARVAVASKDRCPALAFVKVQPLLRLSSMSIRMCQLRTQLTYSRVPVKLPDTFGLKHYVCRCNRLRDGKVGRVNFPPYTSTSRRRLRSVRERAIHIRCISNELTSTTGDIPLPRRCASRAVLDVRVRLWQVVEG